jgi:hypothetical protein
LPDSRAGRSEDERKDDDLKDFAARHRVDNADGKRMLEDLGEAGGGLLESGLRALLERHSHPGLDQIHSAQADEQRHGGDDFEI